MECIASFVLFIFLGYSIAFTKAKNDLNNISFWKLLAPSMHIHDDNFIARHIVSSNNMTIPDSSEFIDRMVTEGYLDLPPQQYDLLLANLTALIDQLVDLNIPIVFAFVFDEYWLLFMRIHRTLALMLGEEYRRLPDFWAWRINPENEDRGWEVHRDKGRLALFDNGMPMSLTVWIPLSDATTLNGCIYILPADRDASYPTGDENRVDWTNARALPMRAGSVVLWNQNVWHWGSTASKRAGRNMRYSVALEYQSNKVPAFRQPLSDPLSFPSFGDRIFLIYKQVYQYRRKHSLSEEFVHTAEAFLRNAPAARRKEQHEKAASDVTEL
jgi:hypothetical protein